MRAWLLAVALAAGCYSPDLPDCEVACSADRDCAPGQTCGRDKLCAAPELSGRCDGVAATPDAGASTPPDAAPPMMVDLRVRIMDLGRVIVMGVGVCEAAPPANGMCSYQVPAGVAVTVRAEPYISREFDKWQPPTCKDEGPTCTFTPAGPMVVLEARFKDD